MNKIDAFFTSFNNLQQEAYERAYTESEKSLAKGLGFNEESLKKYSAEASEKWKNEEQKALEGMRPEQYLETVEDLDELMEMLKRAPILCDDELPDIYLDKLKAFGEPAIDALLKISGDIDLVKDEENLFLVPLLAVKLLGDWKIERAVPHLIKMLEIESENYDIFAGQIKSSLVSMGTQATGLIMSTVEQKTVSELAIEYLLMVLAETGKNNKSDAIFKCLKNTFLTMESKMIGALCLKEYGDGRAVTALRGFLEKNRGKLDQETFYEIISTIKALGGSIEGL